VREGRGEKGPTCPWGQLPPPPCPAGVEDLSSSLYGKERGGEELSRGTPFQKKNRGKGERPPPFDHHTLGWWPTENRDLASRQKWHTFAHTFAGGKPNP